MYYSYRPPVNQSEPAGRSSAERRLDIASKTFFGYNKEIYCRVPIRYNQTTFFFLISMASLFLTSAEQKAYKDLAGAITGDWTVETETLTFKDSEEKMHIRMRNLKISDPKLVAFQKKAADIKTPEDFSKIAAGIDMASVAQDDLIELYFAMGPDALTGFIAYALKNVKTADDVTGLAALSIIRHGLLLSLSPAGQN